MAPRTVPGGDRYCPGALGAYMHERLRILNNWKGCGSARVRIDMTTAWLAISFMAVERTAN
ncbi:hypothetical protein V1292_005820 [Bradyrhizobium sp. AZCC 1719]